jgi:hypothetical protein
MQKTIYISGRITGLNPVVARELFDMAEVLLKEQGHHPINPMAICLLEEGKPWEEYMLEDIRLLFDAHAIYMLPNWQESKGARVEHDIAYHLGKEIIYQEEPANRHHMLIYAANPESDDFIQQLGISKDRDEELTGLLSETLPQATGMVDAMHRASKLACNVNELGYAMMHVGILFQKKGAAIKDSGN